MCHICPSANANEMFIGQQKFWENHRLVPIINNDGMIEGTYLMMNLYMIYKENIRLIEEQDTIDHTMAEVEEYKEYVKIIISNAGQEVIFLRPTTSGNGLIYLKSGLQYDVPLSILEDQDGLRGNKLLKNVRPRFVY